MVAKHCKFFIQFLILLIACVYESAWCQGYFSGNLESRAQFFIRDSTIGASNTPQYDHQLYGAESWLSLNYHNWGFQFGIRYDFFHQSNLFNPQGSFTDQGIGRWYIRKKLEKLDIQAGYIYDQIGSGIVFRTYEERTIGIDNALMGVYLGYDIFDNWSIKAFTGRVKDRLALYRPIVKGIASDWYLELEKGSWSPGFGIVNRTLDDISMNGVVATLNTYTPEYVFEPRYNTYAFTGYSNLNLGSFSHYLEIAYKSPDIFTDPMATKFDGGSEVIEPRLIQEPGSVIYTSLNYVKNQLGITVEYKYTDQFTFRTRPQVLLNQGMINFLPPMTRQNTYRLAGYYNASTQELGEQAFQIDLQLGVGTDDELTSHFSWMDNLSGQLLYREWVNEYHLNNEYRKWIFGLQYQSYNQSVFEGKPGVPNVILWIPYLEYFKQWKEINSLRLELQYMSTPQDMGSWIFGLMEYGIAPKWQFTLSNMYNMRHKKSSGMHFYSGSVVYQKNQSRFQLGYHRQVAGIVCAGGICRFEPAFNGVRFNLITSF